MGAFVSIVAWQGTAPQYGVCRKHYLKQTTKVADRVERESHRHGHCDEVEIGVSDTVK